LTEATVEASEESDVVEEPTSDGMDTEEETHEDGVEVEASEEIETESDEPLSAQGERIKELEHNVVSNTGRVSALTRKLYNTQVPTPLEEGVPPAAAEVGEKWAELEKEYPDIAGGTSERIQQLEARVEQLLEEKLKPIRQAEEERYVDSQLGLVAQAYPDWQNTVNGEEFAGWLSMQPSKIQEMKNSYDAEDYIYLLKGYNTGKSDQINTDKAEQAESLRTSREKKLKANVAVPNRGRAKPSGPPDDFEEAFAWYADKG
jgi:hypothetical protein